MPLRRSSVSILAFAVLVVQLVWRPAVYGQPVPVGPDFQVNSFTTGDQVMPAVVMDAAGNFVVAWTSYGGSGSDTDGASIQAQRYDSSGSPLGAQFQVNTYTTNHQERPSLAMDGAGNFIVVWQSIGGASDGSQHSVQAQRYDSTGTPLGGQFQVNTYTTYSQLRASVATDPAGNFVIAWSGWGIGPAPFDSIQAQRYDAAGTPQGGEFQVNSFTTGATDYPDVAMAPTGEFVVVWQAYLSSVEGQRFDAGGSPAGGQFQVNTQGGGFSMRPSVDMDAGGNFVVVWDGNPPSFTVLGIEGRRYDADGVPAGPEFAVCSPTAGDSVPAIAEGGPGNFVVAWVSYDGNQYDRTIQGRQLDDTGTPQGPQFQVAADAGYYRPPAVAANTAGNVVIVWQSEVSLGSDTDGDSIHARRYTIDATTTTSTSSSSTSSTSSTSTSSTSSSSTSSTSSSSSSTVTSTTSTSSTSSTLPATRLLPGRTSLVRDQVLAQFVSRPDAAPLPTIDVVAVGGTLRVFDTGTTAGDDTYALPAGSRWRGLGNPPGSRGYKYRGAGDTGDPCKLVLVKETIVKATCKGSGVTLRPPFTGDVGIVLSLGTSERYCARFGGDDVRNDATVTRRRNAPAPGACP